MRASQVMEQNLKKLANTLQSSTEKYNCPECGRPVVDVEITIPVTCRKIMVKGYGCFCYQKNEIKNYIEQDEKVHNKDILEMSGIGERFKRCTFDNFNVYFEVSKAFEEVAEYVENFIYYKNSGTGLILKGKSGTGKSHLAAAICQELIFKGYTVKFALVPIILESIRQSYNKKSIEGEVDLIKRLAEVDLLILDDLGAEKPTEWVMEQLFILINMRYEAMRPIIITTNCTGQELADRIGERSASRLSEISRMININAPDYRLRKK